jgi:competence transcription factor ComK
MPESYNLAGFIYIKTVSGRQALINVSHIIAIECIDNETCCIICIGKETCRVKSSLQDIINVIKNTSWLTYPINNETCPVENGTVSFCSSCSPQAILKDDLK